MERIKDLLEELEERYGKRKVIEAMKRTQKEIAKFGIALKHEDATVEFLLNAQHLIKKYGAIGEKFVYYCLLAQFVR